MDANEFNLAVRSLTQFFKTHKGVGLLVIDGMQFMETTDYMTTFERKKDKLNKTMEQQPVKISSV